MALVLIVSTTLPFIRDKAVDLVLLADLSPFLNLMSSSPDT